MHTCMHTYMHICIHACIHTYIYMHENVYDSNPTMYSQNLLRGGLQVCKKS